MSYPIYNGSPVAADVKLGSFNKRTTAEGVSYTFTLIGTKFAIDAFELTRGTDLSVTNPGWGVPAGYYVDELSERVMLACDSALQNSIELDVVCRQPENMGDGILGEEAIPVVYERHWERAEQALWAHSTRYPVADMKSMVYPTSVPLWSYIQEWINAPDLDAQEAVYDAIMGETSEATETQQELFQDYLVMHMRGVEARETWLPVLRRTVVSNTAPDAETPGQIEEPPAAFGSLKPDGFTWRRMPDAVTRTGRVGAYNTVSEWAGDPDWDSRLYGTLAEQADDYQTF